MPVHLIIDECHNFLTPHRVLCVFENDNALQAAAAQRLLSDPAFIASSTLEVELAEFWAG